MSLPVALQLYSVRTELKQDFYGVLEQVKAMGYDGVEFAGLMGENPEKVKKALGSLGLTALSAHVPLADFLADTTGVLKELKQLGVQYAVVPYLPPQRRPNGGDFEETIRQIRQVGEAVASSGLMLLYHNHDFEFVKIDGQYALDMLYDAIPASLLQTELDTCWVRVGGEDPVAYLKKYTGRAPVVHIKDYVGEKSENMYELIGIQSKANPRDNVKHFAFRSVGAGIQDVPSILKACVDANAGWIIVEQDNPTEGMDALSCAKASIDYLKQITY